MLLKEPPVLVFPKFYGAFAFLQMKAFRDVDSAHTIWNALPAAPKEKCNY